MQSALNKPTEICLCEEFWSFGWIVMFSGNSLFNGTRNGRECSVEKMSVNPLNGYRYIEKTIGRPIISEQLTRIWFVTLPRPIVTVKRSGCKGFGGIGMGIQRAYGAHGAISHLSGARPRKQ
jgi:hypothetical protein